MIFFGVILLIIGFVANIAILWTIGQIVALVGVVFAISGRAGRQIGGRAHCY
jgi:hypothetical protein